MSAILVYNIPSHNKEKLIALRIVMANVTLCVLIDKNGKGESSYLKRYGERPRTVTWFRNNTSWHNIREIQL